MMNILANMIKKRFIRRMDIDSVEMDMLVCRHAAVTQRTPRGQLKKLIEMLAPVKYEGRGLIRMGASADSGYLIPDDLVGVDACFSPGVDQVSKFEKDCADYGMKVFMADKSVDRPAENHDSFAFVQKYIGALTTDEFMTMDHWVKSSLQNHHSDLLLQMDIEGAEYEALLCMSDELMQRFRIMVVEFHELDQLWSAPFFSLGRRVFEKILQTHMCVHIHPNNCCGTLLKDGIEIPRIMEFTFLRNDRLGMYTPAMTFPHELDSDCTSKPPIPLPSCWFGNPED